MDPAPAPRPAPRHLDSSPLEPVAWLRGLPPFRGLSPDAAAAVAGGLEITYLAAGTRVLRAGGAPATHLHVVRKGTAVVASHDGAPVRSVEPGEWFGLPSVLDDAPPRADVDAVEDLLVYRLPRAVVRRLVREPAFAAHALAGLADRLRAADVAGTELAATGTDLTVAVAALVRRDPVRVPAEATVAAAAATMRDHGTSSVVVDPPGDGGEPAILTDRDLRARVLAEGRGPDTPAAEVASRPVVTVDAATSVVDAEVTMLRRSIHHLGVTRDGRLIGVVTAGDLARVRATSPLHLHRRLARLTADELSGVRDELHAVVRTLTAGGLGPLAVARTVSALTDTLTRRALTLAEARLGPAPAAYAWLALGSDARGEQTLLTDQDHALVHAEVDAEGAAWFAALAEEVTATLEAAGIPRCPGEAMATRWRGTLTWWRDRFVGWTTRPDVEALYAAGTFVDHRVVAGDLEVGVLDDVVRAARHDRVLLARFAASAATARPALGRFRRLHPDRHGRLDLKAGGLTPIVDLARVLAVEVGSTRRATLDRLVAATEGGTLSPAGAEELAEAFTFLQRLRLAEQLRGPRDAPGDGDPGGNLVALEELGPVTRRHLKQALVAVAEVQQVTLDRLGAREVAR